MKDVIQNKGQHQQQQQHFTINGNVSKEMRVMGHGSQHGKHGTK